MHIATEGLHGHVPGHLHDGHLAQLASLTQATAGFVAQIVEVQVINASALGVIRTALDTDCITRVLGAANGEFSANGAWKLARSEEAADQARFGTVWYNTLGVVRIAALLVQPVVGYLSDRTWTGLGRRRPYFLAGAVLATLALFVMPNSPTLWIAAGTLWILDASINISMAAL